METGCLAAAIILTIGSVYDYKKRVIPGWLVWGSVVVGSILFVLELGEGNIGCSGVFFRMFPGSVFLLLALSTREQIGNGDGLLLLAMGGLLDERKIICICLIGLWLTFPVSFLLIFLGRGSRKTRLPFVPFLLAGYLVVLGGELFF